MTCHVANAAQTRRAESSLSEGRLAEADAGRPPSDAGGALAAALAHPSRGFAVVPQLPGTKHPCVRWKPFQDRQPAAKERKTGSGGAGPRRGSGPYWGR
jgi:hypothetical protein